MIDRIRESCACLPMRGNETQRFDLRGGVLFDDPGAQPAEAFRLRGTRRPAGGGKAARFIRAGPGFSPGHRNRGVSPDGIELFGIEPKRLGQLGHGGVLHIGPGHRLDGYQPPGSKAHFATQRLGGFTRLHPLPADKLTKMNDFFAHA